MTDEAMSGPTDKAMEAARRLLDPDQAPYRTMKDDPHSLIRALIADAVVVARALLAHQDVDRLRSVNAALVEALETVARYPVGAPWISSIDVERALKLAKEEKP